MTAMDATAARLAAILSGEQPWGTPAADAAAALIDSARYHGLGPVLLRHVRAEGVGAASPEWEPLLQQERRVAINYELGLRAQRAINAALAQAGIPTIWIKGFALCHTVYPDPALRSMGDLDFMVPYESRLEALAIVEGIGYRQPMPELFDGHQAQMHHYHLQGGPADAVHVELHYTWGDPAVLQITDEEVAWFWSERRQYDTGRASFASLSPEAHLALVALHALAHHGEEEFVLRRYLDVHLLLSTYPELDWATLVSRATQFGWAAVIGRALETTATLFGTPIPAAAAFAAAPSTAREASWLAQRPAPDTKLRHALGHVGRMPLGLRLRWALALIFPTPAYLKWRYHVQENWKVPFLYPRRWLLVAGEVLKSPAGRRQR